MSWPTPRFCVLCPRDTDRTWPEISFSSPWVSGWMDCTVPFAKGVRHPPARGRNPAIAPANFRCEADKRSDQERPLAATVGDTRVQCRQAPGLALEYHALNRSGLDSIKESGSVQSLPWSEPPAMLRRSNTRTIGRFQLPFLRSSTQSSRVVLAIVRSPFALWPLKSI